MYGAKNQYIRSIGAVLILAVFSLNVHAATKHPGFLFPQVPHAFQEYLAEKSTDGFKVFLVAGDGSYAWTARSSFEAAFELAYSKCSEPTNPWQCDLYAVGETIVWGMPEMDKVAAIAAYRMRDEEIRNRISTSLPPSISTAEGEKAYAEYNNWDEGTNLFKVFVLSENGAWSWSTRFNYEDAESDAIENCEEAPGSRRGLCRPYSVGNTVVWESSEKERQSVVSTYRFSKTSLGPRAEAAPLGVRTLQAYRTYQRAPDFKFFAVAEGAWATSNRSSFELARQETMDTCKKYANRDCDLFAVGDAVVWGISKAKLNQVIDAYRARK